MQKENYDRILYVKDRTYYFERVEGSSLCKVRNQKKRQIIIDGLLDPNVKSVKTDKKSEHIYYYTCDNKKKYFLF